MIYGVVLRQNKRRTPDQKHKSKRNATSQHPIKPEEKYSPIPNKHQKSPEKMHTSRRLEKNFLPANGKLLQRDTVRNPFVM